MANKTNIQKERQQTNGLKNHNIDLTLLESLIMLLFVVVVVE